MSKPKPFQIEEIGREVDETLDRLFPNGDEKRKYALALIGEMTLLFHKKLKQACEFYLKYWDRPGLFLKDFPEFEEEFIKGKFMTEKGEFTTNIYDGYVEWLFKLAFKSVLEEENKTKTKT